MQAPTGQVSPGMQASDLRVPAVMAALPVQAPEGQVPPGMQAIMLANPDDLTESQTQAMMAAVQALHRVHGDAGTGGAGSTVTADAARRPAGFPPPTAILVPPGAGGALVSVLLHLGQGGVAVAIPDTAVYNEPVQEVDGGHRRGRRRRGRTVLKLVRAFSHAGPLATETEDKCPVCLEELGVGQVIRTLPCFHMLHANCSSRYFSASGVAPICPVCRAPVVPNE